MSESLDGRGIDQIGGEWTERDVVVDAIPNRLHARYSAGNELIVGFLSEAVRATGLPLPLETEAVGVSNQREFGESDKRRVEVHPGKEAIVEFDPSLTFECVDDCTWCCQHGVLLYERDFLKLAECASLSAATTQVRGEDFVRKEEKSRDDHVGDDGEACFFLRDDGLCSLHAEHDWKPARCSVFPLSVSVHEGEIHVSVRDSAKEHCDGLDVSERRVIDHLDAFLPAVLWELDDPETRREL